MLAELFDRVIQIGDERRKFDTLPLPGGREILIRHPDGTTVTHEVPAKDREYVTGDLDSFVKLFEGSPNAGVFVPHNVNCEHASKINVMGFFNHKDRREFVILEVALSQALLGLHELDSPQSQKQVIQILRDQLVDCIDPSLLPMLRALDFNRRSDGSSTVDHGRESLGVSVEASVRSKRGELPEVLDVNLPLFADAPFSQLRRTVTVTIDVDAANQRIRFAPRADELHVAWREGIEAVAAMIADAFDDDAVMVVIGKP